jgi:DNA (cytosine-5)-methyltransferase 1
VTLVASNANKLGVYQNHYLNHRFPRITPREAARLQGFPDNFILHANDNKAYHQLGNSVSIHVVKAVAQEVILKTLYYGQQQTQKFASAIARRTGAKPIAHSSRNNQKPV